MSAFLNDNDNNSGSITSEASKSITAQEVYLEAKEA